MTEKRSQTTDNGQRTTDNGEQTTEAKLMKEHHFEKLAVWQRGCLLAQDTYRAYKGSRDFAYRDQMVRSSLSVPSNIAEGSERGSEKEFVRFLRISLGSAAELRTQAYIAGELGILSAEQAKHLIQEAKEIGAMIQGLIRSIKATM